MAATILTITAEVAPPRRKALDEALGALANGAEKPPYAPFGRLPQLHFASATVFDTQGFASVLVFEHNFDGADDPYVEALAREAGDAVVALFSCCVDFPDGLGEADHAGVVRYLRDHILRPAAYHVGNVGRSRERVEREAALYDDLSARLDGRLRAGWRPADAGEVYGVLHEEVDASGATPWVRAPHARQTAWERALPWLRIAAVVAIALLLVVVLNLVALAAAAAVLAVLRLRERRDVPMDPTTLDRAHLRRLTVIEDRYRVNHLASLTVVKPGLLRRLTLRVVLWAANLVARTSTKGTLSGIPTIHFAHWSLLDGGRRLLFLSNYDGSWGSYLDDFVDKASTGLTGIWTNTVGFPRTRFLVLDGARDGAAFKAFARMQQTPTSVWYVAAPYRERGLTVRRVDANSSLREGLASRPGDLGSWLRRW